MRKTVLIPISVMFVIGIGAAFWVVRGLSDFDLTGHRAGDDHHVARGQIGQPNFKLQTRDQRLIGHDPA